MRIDDVDLYGDFAEERAWGVCVCVCGEEALEIADYE
jgi:hypothetical protein